MSQRLDSAEFRQDPKDEAIARLERSLSRERRARQDAEAIAERGLRDLYLSRRRLELLNKIAIVANESNDPLATLRMATKEICQVTGWAIGTVLLRTGEPGDERLEGTNVWYASNPDLMFPFADASQRLVVWPSASPPGCLFIDAHPIWVPDIHAQPGFSRSGPAKRCRLRSGVAAPVLMGQELVAAIEFFGTDTTAPEPEFLDLLMQIGTQAGRVFKRQQHARKLVESATRDPLTGLPNRALFEMRIQEIFAANRAAGKYALSLIYIDLDGFKLVNDTLGHQAGDQLLVAMAKRLQNVTEDIARLYPAGTILLARIGGDEFTILIDAADAAAIANKLASAIHDSLDPVHYIGASEIRAAASIGIAHDDCSYDAPDALMRDADVAMYEAKYSAKADGKPRTVSFDAKMRAVALARLALESKLRRAIDQQEFRLCYQPIVKMATGQTVGFEALLRWPQEDGSFIAPDEFLPVAEQCGLIVPLGTWVLREACRASSRWRATVPDLRPFSISVNVAASQFQLPGFADLVREILIETDARPSEITIELTESAAVLNPTHTARVLDELRTMGIRVSLDDFGTGYSSLAHLQSMSFDTLKIDRSFVMNQSETNTGWTLVDIMMKLAAAMGLAVVAEGVETELQRSQLENIGCRLGQGWLFHTAVPEAEALSLLAQSPMD